MPSILCLHQLILHSFLPSALIRREWKSRYDRVMKTFGSPQLPDARDPPETVVGVVTQDQAATPKRKQGSVRAASCPPDCTHSAPLPSDILIEMKVGVSFSENDHCEYFFGGGDSRAKKCQSNTISVLRKCSYYFMLSLGQ